MNKLIVTLLLVFGWSIPTFSQQSPLTIKGFVIDTASGTKLPLSSIVLLHARDSMLYRFTRTDTTGGFQLAELASGQYILLATYPDYADYVQHLDLDAKSTTLDLGRLGMVLRTKLLEEVLVNRRQAITIRGDTTEYDAASFTIQPNSKVEDLLRQLPGIQVDQDGKITAQGKTVNKVLVDGEEFFGDDPVLVTRNLRGDMIDKVQLYDKRSDQAEFTGVDDGERSKTINLTLKEDKKKGYFGKVEAGAGTNHMYQGQAMVNRFNSSQRISAFGSIGNTGRTGMDMGDSDRFSASSDGIAMEGVSVIQLGGGSDDFAFGGGSQAGRGIPSARNGGAHYADKWNGGKQSVNINYKIGELRNYGTSSTIQQNTLPTGIINTTSNEEFDGQNFQQRAGAIIETRFDTTSTLKVTMSGALRSGETTGANQSLGTDVQGSVLNQSTRHTASETNGQQVRLAALWTKKLRKKGRTLSWQLDESLNHNSSNGFLYSENTFYEADGTGETQIVDQSKNAVNRNTVFNSNITYSEPLSETVSLIANYRFTANNGTSLRQSFNPISGQYRDLDSAFSNDFRLNQLVNQLGAVINYTNGKSTLNMGTRIGFVRFNQTDRYADNRWERNFQNHNPQLSWQYRLSQQQSLTINYQGNNTQPSISQTQPVRVNDDPLNIVLGNPDLKPSYTNSVNIGYNSFKILGNRYLFLMASLSNTHRAIVSNQSTDEVGRSTLLYDNLTGRTPINYNLSSTFSKMLKQWNMHTGLSLNMSGNTYYNLINDEMNRTQSISYSSNINLAKYQLKKFDITFQFGPSYTFGQSSLQRQQNNNGWGANGSYSANIYLPGKIQLTSQGHYSFSAATTTFAEDFQQFIVDASINKKFLKTDALVFSVSVNDIFNQNQGFNRSAYNNMITENRFTTIRRFLLFSLTWDFNKMGGGIQS